MGNRTCRLLPGGCDCLYEQDEKKCPIVKEESHTCCGMIGTAGAKTDFATVRGVLMRETKPDGHGHLSDGALIARAPMQIRI